MTRIQETRKELLVQLRGGVYTAKLLEAFEAFIDARLSESAAGRQDEPVEKMKVGERRVTSATIAAAMERGERALERALAASRQEPEREPEPVSAEGEEEGPRAMWDNYLRRDIFQTGELTWGRLIPIQRALLHNAFRFARDAGRKEALAWSDDDQPIPEDDAIHAAHPLRSGRHDLYQEAMRMVGAKRSKGALVDLVTWLLVCSDEEHAAAVEATQFLAEMNRQLYDALECDGHPAWLDDIIPRAIQVMREKREAESALTAANTLISYAESKLLSALGIDEGEGAPRVDALARGAADRIAALKLREEQLLGQVGGLTERVVENEAALAEAKGRIEELEGELLAATARQD